MRLHKIYLSISLLTLCGLAGSVAYADPATIQYMVTVNTTSAAAQMGYIDFQFNPGGLTTQPANADVANYGGDSVLIPVDPGNGTTGEVSGMLPGTVTLINSETTNEYTEGLTFGTTITFDLDLYGPAISNPNGEGGGTFTLDFLNSDQSAFLFTNDPQNDVPVFTVTINPDGSTTAMTYPSENDGPPVVTFVGPTEVPEPASMALLLCGGLAAFATLGRRRLAKRTI
jgi:hypothetical protein